MLKKPTDEFINKMLAKYSEIEGDELNEKLQKIFIEFNDNTNKYDVLIKVAVLNKIYSTAITNINPVVDKICSISREYDKFNEDDYITFVDRISLIEWVNEKNMSFKRNNISFASKYVHFLSNRTTPIYDSYIWIITKTYLAQNKGIRVSFSNPKNYAEFYETFIDFKRTYSLEKYSNYTIDKFLWIYGRSLIKGIENELSIDLDQAKSELKRRLKARI